MEHQKLANKILVMGIDGMDPELTRYHLSKGLMPNLQKFLERGSAREDLHLLGSHPTITPPMWTTLATGAYPSTHGITCFWRQNKDDLSAIEYNLDSRKCEAEQIWNVTAEAGLKTLVWHWPGAKWIQFLVHGCFPSSSRTMFSFPRITCTSARTFGVSVASPTIFPTHNLIQYTLSMRSASSEKDVS